MLISLLSGFIGLFLSAIGAKMIIARGQRKANDLLDKAKNYLEESSTNAEKWRKYVEEGLIIRNDLTKLKDELKALLEEAKSHFPPQQH